MDKKSRISIFMNVSDIDELKNEAKNKGLSLSTYARMLLLQSLHTKIDENNN